jgi:hypothetical protein
MTARGLDFLGVRSWAADFSAASLPSARALSEELPSLLLPIANNEPVIVGNEADRHRRGRGLAFPAEAQVPVLRQEANGAGRVLLAAVLERLAQAETEWGQLSDTKLGWAPDGKTTVQVEAASALGVAVEHETEQGAAVGLVVPDALGVAGQQEILGAIRNRKVILVPRSVAVALSWCRRDLGGYARRGPMDQCVGHLTVCDLSLGRWSLGRIRVFRESSEAGPRLIPAHSSSLKKTALLTTGLGVLTRHANAEYHDFLRSGFAGPWLCGDRPISRLDPRTLSPRSPKLASLSSLAGDGLERGLYELAESARVLRPAPEWGSSLGVIVTGALAEVRCEGITLSARVARMLGLQLEASSAEAAAQGAALAAAGIDSTLPTWLEMVEQLDVYYLEKNELGDLEGSWQPILVPQLVKAGQDYRNPQPITGLKLSAGHNSVQITIRRPSEDGQMLFRKVESTPGRTNATDIPLVIDAIARPGQGFALVKVQSRELGAFDSRLDWQRMEPCQEPRRPALGYIPSAVVLVPDRELWRVCVQNLWELRSILKDLRSPEEVERITRLVNPKLGRTIAMEQVGLPGSRAASAVFRFSRAMGRNGEPPTDSAAHWMEELKDAGIRWLGHHRRESKGRRWLVKHFGWWHLGCPRMLINPVLDRIARTPQSCSSDDLHVAGLCLADPDEVAVLFRAYLRVIGSAPSPNAWLKAFKNVIKFNEHALKDIDPSLIGDLYAKTKDRLQWALQNTRPLIAQNCLEALLYCLKRRRYQEGFLIPGSNLYLRTAQLLTDWDDSRKMFNKRKLVEIKDTFSRFLRTEGNLQDLATLLKDDDEESEGED